MSNLRGLLDEVRQCFTRNDDLPNDLLSRIDVALSKPDDEVTPEMLNAARDWSVKQYGKPIGNDAAIGCWLAMSAAAPTRVGSHASQETAQPDDPECGHESCDCRTYCHRAAAPLAQPVAEPVKVHPQSLRGIVEGAGGTYLTGGGAAFTSVALARFVVDAFTHLASLSATTEKG